MTEDLVLRCRVRHVWGRETAKDLAAEYDVAASTMRGAVNGSTWDHLPMPLTCLECGLVSED